MIELEFAIRDALVLCVRWRTKAESFGQVKARKHQCVVWYGTLCSSSGCQWWRWACFVSHFLLRFLHAPRPAARLRLLHLAPMLGAEII